MIVQLVVEPMEHYTALVETRGGEEFLNHSGWAEECWLTDQQPFDETNNPLYFNLEFYTIKVTVGCNYGELYPGGGEALTSSLFYA